MQLLEVHDLLEELFLAHQTALLDRNLPAALSCLDQFAELLAAHIADEEKVVLPAYAARVAIPEGGKPEFFHFEHTKLQSSIGEVRAMLLTLVPAGHTLENGSMLAPVDPQHVDVRGLLELLDQEASFKDLLRHHDARERRFLYPLLEAALNEIEQQQILVQVQLRSND